MDTKDRSAIGSTSNVIEASTCDVENIYVDKYVFSTVECTNYFRIFILLVDVGTETLQHFFYSLVPKHSVNAYFVSKKPQIEIGKRNKVFDDSQYKQLSSPNPNPDKFDMSLLIKLLSYFKLTPIKLDSLRTIRNEIVGHTTRAALTKPDFETLWSKVEDILLIVAGRVSEDEKELTKAKITELKDKVLYVPYEQEKYSEMLEACYQQKLRDLQMNSQTLLEKAIRNLHRDYQHNDECLLDAAQIEEFATMIQNDLILYYRRLFCKLQISQFIDEVGHAADFTDIYVKPVITDAINRKQKEQSDISRVMTYHNIFVANDKPCNKIYLSAAAGCGKTLFARWMALTWCQAFQPCKSDDKWFNMEDINEMKTFRLLFLVNLRDVQACDVDTMVLEQLLHNLENSDKYAKLELKYIQKLITAANCIIILDGLDEWSHPLENNCKIKDKRLPHCQARSRCTILTTSRPWKLDVAKLKPSEVDQMLDLNGPEGKLLNELIHKVVKEMNRLQDKEMYAENFVRKLEEKKLTAFSKIPVVLMQLLTLWHDNKPFGKSHCEIYSNTVEFLLGRYFKERKVDFVVANNKVQDCFTDQKIPVCFQNNVYCRAHMDLLLKLGELAANLLFCDTKRTSLAFDVSDAQKHILDADLKMCLDVGILTQEKVSSMSERQSHVSFVHETYQEFFAALYIGVNPEKLTDIEDKLKKICCSIGNILAMSKIFMFMSGLCPEVMSHLCEHLRDTVSKDIQTLRYRSCCEMDPENTSEGQTLNRLQDTMEDCLVESFLNEHNIQLPVSDVFISRWSDELKSLTVHNCVYSLFVQGADYNSDTIKDILNSVTVFNNIQKLWIRGVSESFVVQLLTEHQHSLRVRPHSWRHLECVTLYRVEMSGESLCSLVDSILQLPKSVKVSLANCNISREPRDWKVHIRMIQQHQGLIVDECIRDDDDWLSTVFRIFKHKKETNVELLQFHTNNI